MTQTESVLEWKILCLPRSATCGSSGQAPENCSCTLSPWDGTAGFVRCCGETTICPEWRERSSQWRGCLIWQYNLYVFSVIAPRGVKGFIGRRFSRTWSFGSASLYEKWVKMFGLTCYLLQKVMLHVWTHICCRENCIWTYISFFRDNLAVEIVWQWSCLSLQ